MSYPKGYFAGAENSFEWHGRKSVSPFGVTSWVSELDPAPTVGEAIARAIETACEQTPTLRQAAYPPLFP